MESKTLQKNTKDSGIDWVGNIPRDWGVFRGKFFLKNKKETNKGMVCDNVLSLTMKGVISRSELGDGGLVPSDYSTFQIFQKNDLVFKLIDLENYKTSRVGIVHEKGIMSSAYIRIFPKNNNTVNRYLFYYYYNLYTQGIYNFIGMGVRSTMNAKDLLELDILIPPKETQEKIVSFLDNKTLNIDSLIKKKEKMIELLQERRSSVITHAVTKGLDPHVEMKDSGVDWIGDIPEGWFIKKHKYLFNSISKKEKKDFQISLENIESWTGKYISTDSEYSGDGSVFEEDDILFGKLRPYLAKAFLADKNGEALGDILVYRTLSELIPLYGHKMFLSKNFIDFIDASTYGTKMPRVSPDFIRSLEMVYPPISIQNLIIKYINKETQKIDSTISKVKKQIKLLKEYKSSLIYHAVTGKIEI